MYETRNGAAWRRFLLDDGGQELVEFALVLAVFVAAAMAALAAISIVASNRQATTQNALTNASINPL